MQGLNVIWVFSPDCGKVLMCKRHKEPYKGLYNLVGGKIENGEVGMNAAYRELAEETGITNITLYHLMDFTYYRNENSRIFMDGDVRVEVYFGKLNEAVEVQGDEKELVWLDVSENFFDHSRFAGEGNIGHIHEIIKKNIDESEKVQGARLC
jgi:8-oxo-dGTP diphosphatase